MKKKRIQFLPDMSNEMAMKYYLQEFAKGKEYDDMYYNKYVVALIPMFISVILGLVMFKFLNFFSRLEILLLFGMIMISQGFWIYNTYKCFHFSKKRLQTEEKTKKIIKEYPEISTMLNKKSEDEIEFELFYSFHSFYKNLYIQCIFDMILFFPIIVFLFLILEYFKIFSDTTNLFIGIYSIIALYFVTFLIYKIFKKVNFQI